MSYKTPNVTFTPYVNGVAQSEEQGHLQSDWVRGQQSSEGGRAFVWTHTLEVPLTSVIQDDWPLAGNGSERILVPPGEELWIVLVERERGLRGDEFLRAWLRKDSMSLIIREVDESPSVTATILEFDQDDGFVVTDEGSGVAKVTLSGLTETFLDLTDTPSTYSSEGNRLVMVAPGEAGVSFIDPLDFGQATWAGGLDGTLESVLIWNESSESWSRLYVDDLTPCTSFGDLAVHGATGMERLAQGARFDLYMSDTVVSPGVRPYGLDDITSESTIDAANDLILFFDSSAGGHRATAIENVQLEPTGSIGNETSSFTTDGDDDVVDVSNSSDVTVTLEEDAPAGRRLTILKGADNDAKVTIQPSGSNTIVRESSIQMVLLVQGDVVEFLADGSGNWYVTACRIKPHVVRMTRNSAQSIGSGGSPKQVQLDSTDFDVGGLADLANDQAVIQRSGKYYVTGTAVLQLNASNSLQGYIYVNGSSVQVDQTDAVVNGNYCNVNVHAELALSSGDTVDLRLFHNKGSAVNTETGTDRKPKLMMRELQQ